MNGPGPSGDNPVTTVPCDAQTAALGNSAAGQTAAADCAADPCKANAQTTGVAQTQSEQLSRQPNGGLRFLGGQCAPAPNAKPVVTPQLVWEQAQRLIPRADIGLAPRQATLVNLQTIMWVQAPRQQNLPVVTIFDQPVDVHITLAHVRWNFGDEHTDVADSPGKPYDEAHDPCRTRDCPDYYGHYYAATGHMTITATTEWSATFRVAGGPATPIPGTVDGPTATSAITVVEARGVLVPDPTPR